MTGMSALLNSLAVIITYMLIGYLLCRIGMITDRNRQSFIDFVIKVTLPCMVFKSFLGDMTAQMLRDGAAVLAISSGVCLFAWIVGPFVFPKGPDTKRSIMKFALLVGNIGFVGLPLVTDTFGEAGSFYGSFYLISNVVFNWSVGIAFLSPGLKGKDLIKKVLLNPGIIGVVLGVGRMLLRIPLPQTAVTVVTALGSMTGPMGIILIGAILAGCDPRSVFEKDVLYTTFMKLVALPLCLFAFKVLTRSVLPLDDAAWGVLMVLTAMPAGATTAILAENYGQDHLFASKVTFATTVFSLVTVPLAAMFLC
ncbi:MAG: AEC family transporter [Ruminococcaceae bacterium]|nr:AEC family transporter [Oscillospiraceae bacterium]